MKEREEKKSGVVEVCAKLAVESSGRPCKVANRGRSRQSIRERGESSEGVDEIETQDVKEAGRQGVPGKGYEGERKHSNTVMCLRQQQGAQKRQKKNGF